MALARCTTLAAVRLAVRHEGIFRFICPVGRRRHFHRERVVQALQDSVNLGSVQPAPVCNGGNVCSGETSLLDTDGLIGLSGHEHEQYDIPSGEFLSIKFPKRIKEHEPGYHDSDVMEDCAPIEA